MTTTVIVSTPLRWLRLPHRMDLLSTAEVPEGYHPTTAFVLAVDAEQRTLLTRVGRPGRGWEVPGGHVDPGESVVQAAVRELAEETGLRARPEELTLVGGQQITLLEPPPADYAYPAHAFMAFLLLRLPVRGASTRPDPSSECTEAAWVDREELARRCAGASWLPLHATLFD